MFENVFMLLFHHQQGFVKEKILFFILIKNKTKTYFHDNMMVNNINKRFV